MRQTTIFRMSVFFAVCAIVGAIFMGDRFFTALHSNRWPSVQGQLNSVKQESSGNQPNTMVNYSYEVSGKFFRGDRISYRIFDEALVYENLRSMTGNPIKVYYNPANPGESVLEAGGGFLNGVFFVIVSLGAIAMGFLAYITMLNGSKKSGRHPSS